MNIHKTPCRTVYAVIFFVLLLWISKNIPTHEKLIQSAKSGNSKLLSTALQKPHCNSNLKDLYGRTALFYSIEYGYHTCTLILLNQEDINAYLFDDRKNSPLTLAIEKRWDDITKKIVIKLHQKYLENRAFANDIEAHICQELIHAAKSNLPHTVNTILLYFPDTINRCYSNQTVLMVASEYGLITVMHAILGTKNDAQNRPIDLDINVANEMGLTALAHSLNHPEITKMLFLSGADERSLTQKPLHLAALQSLINQFFQHWYNRLSQEREEKRQALIEALNTEKQLRDSAIIIAHYIYPLRHFPKQITSYD